MRNDKVDYFWMCAWYSVWLGLCYLLPLQFGYRGYVMGLAVGTSASREFAGVGAMFMIGGWVGIFAPTLAYLWHYLEENGEEMEVALRQAPATIKAWWNQARQQRLKQITENPFLEVPQDLRDRTKEKVSSLFDSDD